LNGGQRHTVGIHGRDVAVVLAHLERGEEVLRGGPDMADRARLGFIDDGGAPLRQRRSLPLFTALCRLHRHASSE
jgi:hypothetical protein